MTLKTGFCQQICYWYLNYVKKYKVLDFMNFVTENSVFYLPWELLGFRSSMDEVSGLLG
jgi:hypothetical protein